MYKKLLALLLLSPIAFAEKVVVTDLIGWTWIESSANDPALALHTYRFIEDGRFIAISKSTDSEGNFVWDGAYEIIESNNSFSIYSDDMKCHYYVKKLSSFYRFSNSSRINYSAIQKSEFV